MSKIQDKLFYGREKEIKEIESFLKKPESGLTYLKGRRRVGKSSLLKKVQKNHGSDHIYFSGAADARDLVTRKDFNQKLYPLLKNEYIKDQDLSWAQLFSEITLYLKKDKSNKIVIFFDEIQWIVKSGSGFIGALKEAWVDWEESGRVKIIVCGSSKKFFQQPNQKKETDEVVLKRIKNYTLSDLQPFSPQEVKNGFYPDWTYEQVCFLYMIFGGLPYYINRVSKEKPFLTSINDAAFLKSSIFLDEIQEVLKVEFNKAGIERSIQILSTIGQEGSDFTSIEKKTGLPSSTLNQHIEKLYNYEILFKKSPMNIKPKGKNSTQGVRYFMKDFFLNFYFQVLMYYESRIKINDNGTIFSAETLDSNSGYYINGFTGQAFELFCRYIFEDPNKDLNLKVFKKLNLRSNNFTVGTFWKKETQVDLIVECPNDRTSRVIECKWVSNKKEFSGYLTELEEKSYVPPEGYSIQKVLIASQDPTDEFLEKARVEKTIVISLSDFFEIE